MLLLALLARSDAFTTPTSRAKVISTLSSGSPADQLGLRAVVVGGGPAGVASALALQRLGWSVELFERRGDWESIEDDDTWSVTLSQRAFDAFDALGVDAGTMDGVALKGRVMLGGAKPQTLPMQFRNVNLSTMRIARALARVARDRGVSCSFDHECLGLDLRGDAAKVTFLRDGATVEREADLVIGADGANSAVRAALARTAFGFEVAQDFEGSLEFRVATIKGAERLAAEEDPVSGVDDDGVLNGVGDALYTSLSGGAGVILSPNTDGSTSVVATETLFEGVQSDDDGSAVRAAFERGAPKAASFVARDPAALRALAKARPRAGKTIRVSTFAHENAVLVGDAAHCMINNLGQGCNCALEDVTNLADALRGVDAPADVAPALRAFSDGRKRDADAAASLSKVAFTASNGLLPKPADLIVYFLTYRAFQLLHEATRLKFLMPWQTVVNVDVSRGYANVARTRRAQCAVGLAGFGAVLAGLAVAAARAATPVLRALLRLVAAA